MESAPAISNSTEGNRRPMLVKRIVRGKSRQFGEVRRRSSRHASKEDTATLPVTRMERDFSFANTQQLNAHMQFDTGAHNAHQDLAQLYAMLDNSGNALGTGMAPRPSFDENFQAPPMATQDYEDENDVEVEEININQCARGPEKKKGACKRGKAFTDEEDIIICSGWLNISTDAAIGTNQTSTGLYKRLHRYYLDNVNFPSTRSPKSLQQRWQTIKTAVSKFCGIFSAIERRNESGKNEKDRINDVIRVYQETEPSTKKNSLQLREPRLSWPKELYN